MSWNSSRPLSRKKVHSSADTSPPQQNDGQTQLQECWPATKEDLQPPPSCEAQPGAEDSRYIQHPLSVWPCLRQKNWSNHRDWSKGTTLAHSAHATRQNLRTPKSSIKSGYINQLIRKAIEFKLHSDMKMKDGLT